MRSPEMTMMRILVLFMVWLAVFVFSESEWEGKVIKGNRNALFLVKNGQRHLFPDFWTFSQMGFTTESIKKVSDTVLNSIPLGEKVEVIPMFRPDDFMYHTHCDDPDRMVNDLGIVANLGNLNRFGRMYHRVQATKKIDILLLGGSITAGGYFMEFFRLMEQKLGYNITFHNHGHGATEITYSIFCVGMERYSPDLVLIDFAVNDYGHPKLMDTLIRKALILPSFPVVALANLWVAPQCPPPRYLLHSFHYSIPVLNVCPAVNLCYGKGHMPKHVWELYSKTDGVHPWGEKGVEFLGKLMFAWWNKLVSLITEDTSMDTDGKLHKTTKGFDHLLANEETSKSYILPPPVYASNPIGVCTKCMALADDADAALLPVEKPKGFRAVTRVKVGFGGFSSTGLAQYGGTNTHQPTKSSKKSWQAEKVGAEIKFPFYGSSVRVAIWQRRDGMGVLDAYVDNDRSHVAKASGFFKGYTWAMEKNNTGRSEIIPLFEGLKDGHHNLTLVVSDQPANPWVPGHMVQIFAVLSASDDPSCKDKGTTVTV